MFFYDLFCNLIQFFRAFFCAVLTAVNLLCADTMFSPVPSVIAVIQHQRLEIIHCMGKLRLRCLAFLKFIKYSCQFFLIAVANRFGRLFFFFLSTPSYLLSFGFSFSLVTYIIISFSIFLIIFCAVYYNIFAPCIIFLRGIAFLFSIYYNKLILRDWCYGTPGSRAFYLTQGFERWLCRRPLFPRRLLHYFYI